jgi:hypothetical protein
MKDIISGNTTLIYDGSRNPNKFEYLVQGLVTGASYGFEVSAFNFNGEGALS